MTCCEFENTRCVFSVKKILAKQAQAAARLRIVPQRNVRLHRHKTSGNLRLTVNR